MLTFDSDENCNNRYGQTAEKKGRNLTKKRFFSHARSHYPIR